MSARLVLAGIATAAFGVAFALGATAGDAPHAMPAAQKPISHPLVSALVGTWITKVTGSVEGTGSATFAVGVGDTCMLHDERGEHRHGAAAMKTAGHGVYRVSDDGKTATAWWIDNHAPEMTKVSGPITESGFDLKGETPAGEIRVKLDKTAAGFEFRMFMGGAAEPHYVQTYARDAMVKGAGR
jgi:hypothetical protein